MSPNRQADQLLVCLGTFHFRILQNSNFSDVTDFYSDHNFRIVTQHEEQG